MTTSPPQPATPGRLYNLYLDFWDEQSGNLADPTELTLDITYSNTIFTYSMDVPGGGPFTYTGASSASPGTIWRISTGQYGFQWQVPSVGAVNGVYVANWVCTYGVNADEFLVTENFPLTGGFIAPIPSGDLGYWTGTLTYQPTWSPSLFSIPLGQTDQNGITWVLKSVLGWDSPPSVGQVIQRSADHGGWPAIQTFGPRIITLDVLASAPTQELRDTARALLQQAVPVGDLGTFTYNEPVPKLAYIRRNASAAVTEIYPTLTDVEFTIPLVAPDPRKYDVNSGTVESDFTTYSGGQVLPLAVPFTLPAAPPSQGGQVTAVNAGTFETRPSITITGQIVAPVIANTTLGQSVSYSSLTLGDADVLAIDFDARQGYLNGAYVPADPASAWWVMQPGTNNIQLSGSDAVAASVTVTWSNAWI